MRGENTAAWSGPFRPFEYWADLAEDEPDFLIDGLVHATTNTVSGKPTVGKTRLVAAMAAAVAKGDEKFCGSTVLDHGPVMVVSTDAGETRRWGLRMREHGVPDGMVGIAKFNPADYRGLYSHQARGARLMIVDNLTGALGSRRIGDDDAAREMCEPLAEIAENGTTVIMIAHSAKNYEAGTRITPTGVMGSTVYGAWERLNVHIHDVTEPNVRAVAIRSNDNGNRDILLRAEWSRSSAAWELMSEREDTRQRTEETHQRRQDLFDEVADDPELATIGVLRELSRALCRKFPDRWRSEEGAKSAFGRAKSTAGGVFTDGRWRRP